MARLAPGDISTRSNAHCARQRDKAGDKKKYSGLQHSHWQKEKRTLYVAETKASKAVTLGSNRSTWPSMGWSERIEILNSAITL